MNVPRGTTLDSPTGHQGSRETNDLFKGSANWFIEVRQKRLFLFFPIKSKTKTTTTKTKNILFLLFIKILCCNFSRVLFLVSLFVIALEYCYTCLAGARWAYETIISLVWKEENGGKKKKKSYHRINTKDDLDDEYLQHFFSWNLKFCSAARIGLPAS